MNKISHPQLELFSSTGEPAQASPEASRPLLKYLVNYERAVFIIIGFIIIGTAAFCLGVEKGKGMVAIRQEVAPKTALPQQKATVKLPEKSPVVLGGYTIQVASFETSKYAQKETEVLKKKGLNPMMLSKGGYTVVCVGSFTMREEAKILLSELKKQYHNCYIRRL